MQERVSTVRGVPANHMVGSLIIVAREQHDLWHALTEEFKDIGRIHILLDRRRGERRSLVTPVAQDRRMKDRRSLLRLEDDLRARKYVLVRPHYPRPSD